MCLLGLSCTATNLWEQEIDTERCVLVVQEALQLCDLLAEHVWSVADTADDTDTTSVGHSGGELRTSGHVHASKHDWVLDLEQIGRGGAELLCFRSACLVAGGLLQGGEGGIRGDAMIAVVSLWDAVRAEIQNRAAEVWRDGVDGARECGRL